MIRKLGSTGALAAAIALAVCLGLLAAPATAETYTVILDDGSSFLSRYAPERASWDPEIVLVLTDVGNWIGIDRAEIASIDNETDSRGFGLRINTTTISFGYLANDAPVPEEDGGAVPPPFQVPEPRSYDIEQFVEPSESGGGGVPVFGIQYAPSSGGSSGFAGTGLSVAPSSSQGREPVIDQQ